MKRVFPFLSTILAILLVFTNDSMSETSQSCTWFLFDDNSLTNPGATGNADGTATHAEADDPKNYRLVNIGDLNTLCPSTVRLCAICAQHSQTISGNLKPQFVVGDAIVTAIDAYFAPGGNNPAIIDYPNSIKEKFTVSF